MSKVPASGNSDLALSMTAKPGIPAPGKPVQDTGDSETSLVYRKGPVSACTRPCILSLAPYANRQTANNNN